MKNLYLIGAASGLAAGDHGCADGPFVVQRSNYWSELEKINLIPHWKALLQTHYQPGTNTIEEAVRDWCQEISKQTQSLVQNQQMFAVIGGDHSCAIGTWSGVYQSLHSLGPLGLIWVDAHLDSHTPETSESGNIHGMPTAALLGYGHPLLTSLTTQSPLLPENLCFIGIRSFEKGEEELVKRLGIKVYYMDEVKKCGIDVVMKEAIAYIRNRVATYGISIDLDGFDPSDAPGVGTPEANGIKAAEFCPTIYSLSQDPKFVGFEIAEYNPHHDQNKQTEKLIMKLISSITLGKEVIL